MVYKGKYLQFCTELTSTSSGCGVSVYTFTYTYNRHMLILSIIYTIQDRIQDWCTFQVNFWLGYSAILHLTNLNLFFRYFINRICSLERFSTTFLFNNHLSSIFIFGTGKRQTNYLELGVIKKCPI